MAIDTTAILDAVVDHALRSGHFERVNKHEPAHSPGNGLTAAVWVDRVQPVAAASGLRATSARVALNLRIYAGALQEPRDAIDPAVMAAVDALMTAYSGDFDLDGLIRNVDLLGAHGQPLGAQAGYLDIQGVQYRVMTITIPCIVNDAWIQSP